MYNFDSLMNEILRSRSDITREEVMSLVAERKKTVGAGFLTDQGALFLIAGEFGVQLRQMTPSTDLALKDLYVGANDITVLARVGAVYPISEFKKKDGGTGKYRRLVLFDESSTAKLTIWDDNPDAINLTEVSVDSPIRVLNAYVRQGLDGKPNLNLGRRGKVELLQDEALVSKLSPMSKRLKNVAEIGESQDLVGVEGQVLVDSRSSNFTRQDGSGGSLTQFELGGEHGERVRVVIWNAVNVEVKTGQRVMATNLRVKQSINRERELHGDNGSLVRVLSGTGKEQASTRFSKVDTVKAPNQKYSVEGMALSNPRVREVQLKDGSSVEKAELLFGDDTGEITVVGWRSFVETVAKITVGEKVRIVDAVLRVSRMGSATLELGDESRVERIPT